MSLKPTFLRCDGVGFGLQKGNFWKAKRGFLKSSGLPFARCWRLDDYIFRQIEENRVHGKIGRPRFPCALESL